MIRQIKISLLIIGVGFGLLLAVSLILMIGGVR